MADWIRVASSNDLVAGTPLLVIVDGVDISLYRYDDAIYATEDLCSHAEASLAEGEQDGCIINCPRHGGQFDIRTGEAKHFPAFSPIRTFPVQEENGSIFIQFKD